MLRTWSSRSRRIPVPSRTLSTSSSSSAKLYGQPTASSHPHLLKPGELTPGISREEYKERRNALFERLPDNSVAIACSASVKYASKNIFYKFRQASDFFYLSGILEPESVLLLEKKNGTTKSTVFMRPNVPSQELWDGPRTGPEDAPSLFSIDSSLPIDSLSSHLSLVLPDYSHIFLDSPSPSTKRKMNLLGSLTSPKMSSVDSALGKIPWSRVRPLGREVHHMRKVKSPAEVALMRKAATLSGDAHAKTMRFTEPGMSESTLGAHFEYLCSLRGSERPAYVPVVASGSNALVIHYTANDCIIDKDDLILVDAGCELHGYASDITRTWPASGRFTEPQRDLYQAVLNTLKTVTSLASESQGHTLESLHWKSTECLGRELKQVGWDVSGRDLERIYPHFIGHPLGLDLHESGEDQRRETLKESMAITIEPGVYVPPDSRFPKHFHNIGIRIEDEVLVLKDDVEVLSASAPKEVVDVEGACQGVLGGSAFW